MSAASIEATFAFVDMAGFTALTETHGDAEALAIVRAFQERVRQRLEPGDELVKTIGDAVMLKFDGPRRAVVALRELIEAELTDAPLLPRVGAHHGAAMPFDGDYYGGAVNLAARVAAEAAGGQLLVTGQAASAARDLGAPISHVGSVTLRNVAAPVDIYDVRVDATSEHSAIDPICHMRSPGDGSGAVLRWDGRDIWFCGLPCVAQFAASTPAVSGTWSPHMR
jgi:adenylate cyclase